MQPSLHILFFSSLLLLFSNRCQSLALSLAAGENWLYSAVISPSGDYAYFGTSTVPARIVKVALGNFTRVGNLTLKAGEELPYTAVISPSGDYAYFATYTSPG